MFDKVISTANRLGIGNDRKLGNFYPLAIGAYEETLMRITAAYSAITNRGIYKNPSPIEKILGPDNRTIWSHDSHKKKDKRVLSQDVADTLNWMLQQSVINGTGSIASLKTRQVAGKTGTSEGNRDLWFIGSIPQLTTGVWFGNDNNKETKMSSGNAAWAWKKYIQAIEKDFKVIKFKMPNALKE